MNDHDYTLNIMKSAALASLVCVATTALAALILGF